MTNNASNTKKKNTSVTAKSTSDPSDSQPVPPASQNPSPKNNQSLSSKPKPAPLQPDPQNTDHSKPTSQTSPTQSPPSFDQGSQSYGAPPPRQQPSPQGGFDDWGFNDPLANMDDGFGGGFGGGLGRSQSGDPYSSGRPPTKRMTPEERVQMIERVYNEILQRKPDTRDINYYKYSTLTEDQIRKQLITSAEHTDMVKRGREYQKIKEHAGQLESRVHMLEGQIKDNVEEFRELSNLLQEKNRLIKELRTGNEVLVPHPKEGPIDPERSAQPVSQAEAGVFHPSHDVPETPEKEQPSLRDPSPLIPEVPEKIFENAPPQPAPPPQNQQIFTASIEAPAPPDIQTENGIITAEQNSPGRRIKQTLRDLFSSFF